MSSLPPLPPLEEAAATTSPPSAASESTPPSSPAHPGPSRSVGAPYKGAKVETWDQFIHLFGDELSNEKYKGEAHMSAEAKRAFKLLNKKANQQKALTTIPNKEIIHYKIDELRAFIIPGDVIKPPKKRRKIEADSAASDSAAAIGYT